jgi:2-iminoacetate synthase ThiH
VSAEKLVQRHASALEDLKTIAVSRLMLDNFPHVKAYWIMLQEDTAAIALNFGADDIDGTISGSESHTRRTPAAPAVSRASAWCG